MNMLELIEWVEGHEVSVGLAQTIVLILLAWITGVFSYLRRFSAKPRLKIASTASFVFVENIPEYDGKRDAVRASFVINASLINASNEKVVLDHFHLSFRTHNLFRSHRQKLLRIAFPSRPRKQLGNGVKYMGVWFTEFEVDDYKLEHAVGILGPKEMCSGYLLFNSFTWGGWNPRITAEQINVRLSAQLTSGKWIKETASLQVVADKAVIEEFSPGLVEHVAHQSTWNHDLSQRSP